MSKRFGCWFNRFNNWFTSTLPRRGRVSARANSRRAHLTLESLEDRLVPAVYNVIGTADGLGMVTPTRTAGVFNATTLRAAITAANANSGGNTINLAVPGTYKITLPGAGEDNNANGDFDILASGGNLTVQNSSHGAVTVDGNHLDRVFDINPNFDPNNPTAPFTVTFTGITITGGIATDPNNPDGPNASGGGIRDTGNASLTLNSVVVTGNSASADGGGVVMENTVSTPWILTVNNSVISNNHAGDAGGGIDVDGSGKVFINAGTVITGNTSVNQGAGIWLDAIQFGNVFQTANLKVNGTLISNNQALAAGNVGGGIGNAGNGAVTITNSTIANNFSDGVGGGFGDEHAQGTLNVVNSLFLNNVAAGQGGGIETAGPLTTITSSELKGNESGLAGGGLFAGGTTLLVQSSTLANNVASGDGQGLGGGGIELETTGTGLNASFITDSTITGNIALNNAGANGGGIDAPATFTGDLVLLNDTLNANYATAGGGIFWAGTTGSTFNVENTLVASNLALTGPDANNAAGAFTDNGGNLIGLGGPANGNNGFTVRITQMGTTTSLDPLLGPLGNYGGPVLGATGSILVLETEALQKGSPALGKGLLSRAPANDERGFPSTVNGAIDVGAVSAIIPASQQLPNSSGPQRLIVTTTVNGVTTTTYNVNSTADILNPPPGVLTLRAAIQDANNTLGNKIINLTAGGDYKITIPGAGEDNNATGDFDILPSGGNVTIQNTSGHPVTVDGNHLDRVFDINPADDVNFNDEFTVTLKGFTITNGIATDPNNPDGPNASGGGIRDQGIASLTLTNVIVTNNLASADGGGVVMENTVSTPWTLTINNSVISNNHAGDAGGGIDADGSGKIFINAGTVITGNTSVNQGAGIWLDAIQDGPLFQTANLTVFGALISSNQTLAAGNVGGGIGNAGNGVVTITNSTIANNFSDGVGGGFGDEHAQGTLIVVNSLFLDNVAAGQGGGIETAGPATTITGSELKGNESGLAGGGLFAGGITLTLKSSTLANNVASGDGQGLGGGGIELETTGTGSTITDSTITGNLALNSAGANGGGIDAPATFTGSVALLNDTINANYGTNGGGIFWAGTNGSIFSLQNTIVDKDLATTGPDLNNLAGAFTDNGGNLIGLAGPGNGDTGLGAAFGGLASTQVGTTTALDALLAALGNYGGPSIGALGFNLVLETEGLKPGSPALGKGIVAGAPATDERGFPSMVNGKVNIGAV